MYICQFTKIFISKTDGLQQNFSNEKTSQIIIDMNSKNMLWFLQFPYFQRVIRMITVKWLWTKDQSFKLFGFHDFENNHESH